MRYPLIAITATMLCVGGGMMTGYYFPWNLVPILVGGGLVGWLGSEARRANS